MAKTDFDYLNKKYGADKKFQEMLQSKDYRNILKTVFKVNVQEISEKTGTTSREIWKQGLEKAGVPTRKYIVPELLDMITPKTIIEAKANESVDGISGNLRTSLTQKLRDTMNEFEGKHREKTYLKKRINPKLEDEFEDKIKRTFRSYVKRDEILGMPSNIHAIAVTELRSAISNAKQNIAQRMKEQNPELAIKKRWIHNPHLSKDPKNIRPGHRATNNKVVPLHVAFIIPVYKSIDSRNYKIGEVAMMYPHDPYAPADQVISCHCDCEYEVN
jgi:hypothetical protein